MPASSVPRLKLDKADIKGFALKSSIALYGHNDKFVGQAYPKHRANMPQPVAVAGPLILSDRNPEAVEERYQRLHKLNLLMDASDGRAFYRQKDHISEFGEMFMAIPGPLREIHQVRDRKDKSMPPSGYSYSRVKRAQNQAPEPYDCTIDAVRPRTVGWSSGNQRALEPMPAEFEQLATVVTSIRPSTQSGALGRRESIGNTSRATFMSLGPNDETGREGGMTRAAMVRSRSDTGPGSPLDNSLMQASQSSMSRLSAAEKSLKSRLGSAHSRADTSGASTKRYDALGVGKVWEASKRMKRKLRLQQQQQQTLQQRIDAEREKERNECIADLDKFDLNMNGGRKRFEGWP